MADCVEMNLIINQELSYIEERLAALLHQLRSGGETCTLEEITTVVEGVRAKRITPYGLAF